MYVLREISPKTTKIYDNLGEGCYGGIVKLIQRELPSNLREWCDKVREFKMSITN